MINFDILSIGSPFWLGMAKEFHRIKLENGIVEALFWFHPIVWWTGSRLVPERELACDESVLQSGKNPRAYAEGILKVCEHYFMSPSVCVSGVIGADLKTALRRL